MSTIKIAIADEQSFFRLGLTLLLHGVDEFELLAEAHSGRDLLKQLHRLTELPEIVLIDIEMSGMNVAELNRVMRQEFPSIKIVLVAPPGQERLIGKMIEAGACGHLVKNSASEELVACVKAVHKTGFYFSPGTLQAMRTTLVRKRRSIKNEPNVSVSLPSREQEILYLVCRGLTISEIADKLFLSIRAVETLRANLLDKTGCRNAAGLVLFAVRYGYPVDFL